LLELLVLVSWYSSLVMGGRCSQCLQKERPSDASLAQGSQLEGAAAAPLVVEEQAPLANRVVGSKVAKAMSRFGQQLPSGGFASEEGRISLPPDEVGNILRSLSAQTFGKSWAIAGIYEHQALKVGLRRLDEAWEGIGLTAFPIGKGALLKETLLRSLLSGDLHIKSLPGADVVGAQPDLHRLSLVQLLRLRVILLDFTPSGAGGAGVSTFNGQASAENFVRTLDGALFKSLGEKLISSGAKSDANVLELGRDAVLMVAAASAVPSPAWWCWWLPVENGRRMFFDAAHFHVQDAFPEGGVLEVDKKSKPDRNDPTGNLIQMDWQIKCVTIEAELCSDAPIRGKSGVVANVVSVKNLQEGRERLKST